MMKIYELWTNDGDWGGCYTEFIIAESEAGAIAKSRFYQDDVERGYSHGISKCSGNRLLHRLVANSNIDDYIFEYTIKKKEEK